MRLVMKTAGIEHVAQLVPSLRLLTPGWPAASRSTQAYDCGKTSNNGDSIGSPPNPMVFAWLEACGEPKKQKRNWHQKQQHKNETARSRQGSASNRSGDSDQERAE